jgi:hypothetical protein
MKRNRMEMVVDADEEAEVDLSLVVIGVAVVAEGDDRVEGIMVMVAGAVEIQHALILMESMLLIQPDHLPVLNGTNSAMPVEPM